MAHVTNSRNDWDFYDLPRVTLFIYLERRLLYEGSLHVASEAASLVSPLFLCLFALTWNLDSCELSDFSPYNTTFTETNSNPRSNKMRTFSAVMSNETTPLLRSSLATLASLHQSKKCQDIVSYTNTPPAEPSPVGPLEITPLSRRLILAGVWLGIFLAVSGCVNLTKVEHSNIIALFFY